MPALPGQISVAINGTKLIWQPGGSGFVRAQARSHNTRDRGCCNHPMTAMPLPVWEASLLALVGCHDGSGRGGHRYKGKWQPLWKRTGARNKEGRQGVKHRDRGRSHKSHVHGRLIKTVGSDRNRRCSLWDPGCDECGQARPLISSQGSFRTRAS